MASMLTSPLLRSSTGFACKELTAVEKRTLFEQRARWGIAQSDCVCTGLKEEAFMRRRGFSLVVAMLASLLASTHAFAQGGGASTTGSINGKVADASGGVLPGVTVTASSPSLMGVQTSVTDTGGNYRFPALPPGTYTLTFELAGFNTLKRENIQIAMGFTAAVNVELGVASLNETVT